MEEEEKSGQEGQMGQESGGSAAGAGDSGMGSSEPPPQSKVVTAGEFNPDDPVNSFVEVWKGVITTPAEFFTAMPKSGGLLNPTLFALINLVIFGIGTTVVTFGRGFAAIIATPLFGIIGLFIGAAILFLCAKIVGGSGDYEGTYRVIAYASATDVVAWIPIVGWLASLYAIYLAVVGIAEAHRISQGKALVAVLIPVVVIMVLGIISALLIGGFVVSSMRGLPR